MSAVSDPDLARKQHQFVLLLQDKYLRAPCVRGWPQGGGGCFQILPFVPNLTLPCPFEGSRAPENRKPTCSPGGGSLRKISEPVTVRLRADVGSDSERPGSSALGIISKRALSEGRLGLGVVTSSFLSVFDTGEVVLL